MHVMINYIKILISKHFDYELQLFDALLFVWMNDTVSKALST